MPTCSRAARCGQGAGRARLGAQLLCERSPGASSVAIPPIVPMRVAIGAARTRAHAGGRGARDASVARRACRSPWASIRTSSHVARQPNRSDVLIEQVRELIARLGVAAVARRRARRDHRRRRDPQSPGPKRAAQDARGAARPRHHFHGPRASARCSIPCARACVRCAFAPLAAAEIAGDLRRARQDRHRSARWRSRGSRVAAPRARLRSPRATNRRSRSCSMRSARRATLDFARRQALAQEFFGRREQAAENFELIARLLEEMLCFKLIGRLPAACARSGRGDDRDGRSVSMSTRCWRTGRSGLAAARRGRRDGESAAAGRAIVDDGGRRAAEANSGRARSTPFESGAGTAPDRRGQPSADRAISTTYLAGGLALKRGDRVLVEGEAGVRIGRSKSNRTSRPARSICRALRPVVRLADDGDLDSEEETLDREAGGAAAVRRAHPRARPHDETHQRRLHATTGAKRSSTSPPRTGSIFATWCATSPTRCACASR